MAGRDGQKKAASVRCFIMSLTISCGRARGVQRTAHPRGTPVRYACTIMQQLSQPRRRHTGAWVLALFALAELGVIATLIAFRANACSAIGFVPIGAATMRLNGDGNDEAGGSSPPPTPASQPSAAIQPPASTGASAAGAGDVKTAGDTNQVPDPNCVAKAAAAVLTSSPAPAASASCAPMSPPPALKSAEQQIQSGSVTASSPPSP